MHSNKFKAIYGFMAQNHFNSSSQDSDDEEEHFVDAKDDEDAAEEMESKDDDAASDEGCSGNIADDVKAGQSSWVHRKNLSCNNLIINCFDCEMINQVVNYLNEMPNSPMQL